MLYSIKNVEELENLNHFVSLQNQVQEVRLQDILCKQNFHESTRKLFEPVTETIRKTSENLTKTITESSIKNNKALETLNEKVADLMNDIGMIALSLASSLVLLVEPENTSQFILMKDHINVKMKDV